MTDSPARPPEPRADLAALDGYHSPQVEVDVRLNTNEAPDGPPQAFSAAVAEAVLDIAWNRYPDRSAHLLRVGIAAVHDLVPEQVFAANGSNEVLQTVLMCYAGSGRRVLTFEPTYALHQHIARIVGSTVICAERNADFGIDVDVAVEVLREHRPSVTFLCSPNNPTGVVDSLALTRAVLAEVEAFGGLLVVDEAYGQFAEHSAISLLSESNSVVVTRTFSKTWAMAGARLGYLLGPEGIVSQLEKVVLPYHLDAVTQAAGTMALRFVSEMEDRVRKIVEQRGEIESGLAALGCKVWPSGANFVLFRPPAGDGERVWQELVNRSVLVRNTASWPRLEGSLRVTVGSGADNRRFLTAMAEVLEQP